MSFTINYVHSYFNTFYILNKGLREQNMFFNDILPRVKSAVDEIKEVHTAYESLVAECRKEFGSKCSCAEQQSKRKRKRNLQKELKKKAKKAPASTQSDSDECVT